MRRRMFRTFSLTVQLKEMDEPCWIPCIEQRVPPLPVGDGVQLTGFFQARTYEKEGEPRRFRQFIVKAATLERAKDPDRRGHLSTLRASRTTGCPDFVPLRALYM